MNFDTGTYFELNGVLVRFWKDHGVKDKDEKISYLERLIKWYKQDAYAVQDKNG